MATIATRRQVIAVGVVHQGFALEDGDQTARQADPAGDRGSGDGIRRSNHGTQSERHRKTDRQDQPRDQPNPQGR